MISDPLGDMITRIRNAQKSFLSCLDVPYSKQKEAVLKVLKSEGYINDYAVQDVRDGIKNLFVSLKYSKYGKPAIDIIERVSKPGRKFYSSCIKLKPFFNGMGIHILSTSSHGVISDKVAKKANVGGEVICKVF